MHMIKISNKLSITKISLLLTICFTTAFANAATCNPKNNSDATFNNASYISGTITCSYTNLSSYTVSGTHIKKKNPNWKNTCAPIPGSSESSCKGNDFYVCDGGNTKSCSFITQ